MRKLSKVCVCEGGSSVGQGGSVCGGGSVTTSTDCDGEKSLSGIGSVFGNEIMCMIMRK